MRAYRIWRAHREAFVEPHSITPQTATDRGVLRAGELERFEAAVRQRGVVSAVLRCYVVRAWQYIVCAAVLLLVNPLVPVLMERCVTALSSGSAAAQAAALLFGAVAASAVLRFMTTAYIRLLVYRIDFGVSRLLYRRLLVANPRWLDRMGLSTTGAMRQIPAQLSQYAFAVEQVMWSLLLVAYVVVLVVFYGWAGCAVAVCLAVGASCGVAAMRWLNSMWRRLYDAGHSRLAHVDALTGHTESLHRTGLMGSLLGSLRAVRGQQMVLRCHGIRRSGTVGLAKGLTTDVALVIAAVMQVWLAAGLTPGEGIALLVLTRLALQALDENLLTYGTLKFAHDIAADADELLSGTNQPETMQKPESVVAQNVVDDVTHGTRSAVHTVDAAASAQLAAELSLCLGSTQSTVTVVGRQQPWPDGKIAQVITLWDQHVDVQWYEQCLAWSALGDDLAVRALGDAELLSSVVESLSDGQRARLSLAQALYSRPDVLILDEVLAPLDRDVAVSICQRLRHVSPEITVVLLSSDESLVKLFLAPGDEPGGMKTGAALGRQYKFSSEYVSAAHDSVDDELFDAPKSSVWAAARSVWTMPRLVAVVCAQIAGVVSGLVMAGLLDQGVTSAVDVWWLVAVAVVSLAVAWVVAVFPGVVSVGALDRLHTALVGQVVSGKSPTAREVLGARVGKDFDDVESDVPEALCAVIASLVSFGVTAWVIVSHHVLAGVGLVVVTVVGVLAFRSSTRARVRGSHLYAACNAPTRALCASSLGVRAHHGRSSLAPGLVRRMDDAAAVDVAAYLHSSAVMIRLLFTIEVLGVAVFGAGLAAALWGSHTMQVVSAGVVVFASYAFCRELSAMIETLMNAQTSLTSVARVAAVFGQRDVPSFKVLRQHGDGVSALAGALSVPSAGPGRLRVQQAVPDVPKQVQPVPVSFEAGPGQWVFLVGPSGSGKSSLLRMLAGRSPVHGEWAWHPILPSASSDVQPSVSYVDSDLPALPLSLQECLPADAKRWFEVFYEAAHTEPGEQPVKVPDELWRCPLGELSHSDRQVLGVAVGLSGAPDVLLLDEATSALSNAAQERVVQALRTHLPQCVVVAATHRVVSCAPTDGVVHIRASHPG